VIPFERHRVYEESVDPVWVDETSLEALARRVLEILGLDAVTPSIAIDSEDGTENIRAEDPGVFSDVAVPRRIKGVRLEAFTKGNEAHCTVSLHVSSPLNSWATVRISGMDAKLVTFARLELLRFFRDHVLPGGWIRRFAKGPGGFLPLAIALALAAWSATAARRSPLLAPGSPGGTILLWATIAVSAALVVFPFGAMLLIPAVEFRGRFAESSRWARRARMALKTILVLVLVPLFVSIAANFLWTQRDTTDAVSVGAVRDGGPTRAPDGGFGR
jgi:hypothetical protein